MSIFDRMNRVVKSNLNSLVESAEDPGKLIDQTILDLEAELKRAKGDLVSQLGTSKRLDKKAQEADEEIQGWENKAVLALKAGDEDLAREALRMKQKAKQGKDNLLQQANTAAAETEKLQSTIETAEQRVADLKAKKSTLAAQVRAARGAGGRSGGAVGELDRLTNRIDQFEAEVEASSVIDDDPKRAEIEARFRALEKKSGGAVVEDELSALKKKLEGA
jgi:phage shock protein A